MKFTHTNSPIQTYASRILVFLICVSTFASFSLAQKTSRTSKSEPASALAAPVPIPFPGGGNTTCAELNALHTVGQTNNVYSHITTNFELKYDSLPSLAPGNTHTFSTGDGWFLGGGAGTDLANRVNVVGYSSVPGGNRDTLDWRSTKQITAVIVKAQGSNVYLYNPGSFGGPTDGFGLTTLNGSAISHVAFCYELSGGSTAGDGSISGRVVNSYGAGIANARMTVINAATGETSTALTSPFGYYTVDNLEVGKFYLLQVAHKRYSFAESSKTMTLNDSLADIDFIANP